VKDNRICLVSEQPFAHPDWQVIEYHGTATSKELIADHCIKDGQAVPKKIGKPANKLRVALITNWQMECGLANYIRDLANELVELIGELHLFVERNPIVPSYLNPKLTPDKITPCWKRGEPLTELAQAIKNYQPDIVLINHEWGIFSNARYWLSLLGQLSDFRVISILHSIFWHQDKLVSEAPMKEVVVHLDGAKHVLKEKGNSATIHVLPHGCPLPSQEPRLWNCYKSEHTIVQQGFGFAYKGYENSIRAIALLKDKYPDIFFTGLYSESPYAKVEHDTLYHHLMEIVDKLGVANHVALIRGYQSDKVLDAYLRTNKVAIFPYAYAKGHECFGSSGAAPYAMSKGVPVITSSINHFCNLPTIKADTPQAMAEQLDRLFSDPQIYRQQIEKQNAYLQANSWAETAKRFAAIFEDVG
jgi:glycosyltransferase involved in cell wall biosynthesis